MAMDLMTPEGKEEAERLARALPAGDRTIDRSLEALEILEQDEDLDSADLGDGESDESLVVRYDAAVLRVVTARRRVALLRAVNKEAKDELESALVHLQNLRRTTVDEDEDEDEDGDPDEPRQLPLRRT